MTSGAALGISIMLAYLLMAVLYNSLIHPFVILFGLPLAFGGAVIATFLFHYTINVFSMIGMILLVGLAIKNGKPAREAAPQEAEKAPTQV